MIGISAVIIARNEEKNILRCLKSVRPFTDEIVVVDSMSTDATGRICSDFGCKLVRREFDGYGSQKQFAVDQAANNWVFSIDADEVVSDELCREILEWKKASTQPQIAGFNIPFSLHYMGRTLKYGGVGNEYHLRLFDRERGSFTRVPVHEGVEIRGITGTMNGRIIHYSYSDLTHHITKINTYTTRAAEGYSNKGKTFSPFWLFFKFPVTFLSVYLIKRGFLDGYPGFIWSFMAAFYSSLKVAKTIEMTPRR